MVQSGDGASASDQLATIGHDIQRSDQPSINILIGDFRFNMKFRNWKMKVMKGLSESAADTGSAAVDEDGVAREFHGSRPLLL